MSPFLPWCLNHHVWLALSILMSKLNRTLYWTFRLRQKCFFMFWFRKHSFKLFNDPYLQILFSFQIFIAQQYRLTFHLANINVVNWFRMKGNFIFSFLKTASLQHKYCDNGFQVTGVHSEYSFPLTSLTLQNRFAGIQNKLELGRGNISSNANFFQEFLFFLEVMATALEAFVASH